MLKFASQEEALQHLSDLTGKKIKIAGVNQFEDELKKAQQAYEINMKKFMSDKMNAFCKKHGIGGSDPVDGDVYSLKYNPIKEIIYFAFNDERMGDLISGNIAASVYNDFEKLLKELNFEMTDNNDGSGGLEVKKI